MYNQKDYAIYNALFSKIPTEWKQAPPTESMIACRDFFKDNDVKTVLDIGCGPGLWSIYLANHGFDVDGFDFSPNAIQFAKRWAAELTLAADFRVASVLERPFKEKRFNGILAAKIIDNLPENEVDALMTLIDNRLTDNGFVFALFNPEKVPAELSSKDNPTKDTSSIRFSDQQIKSLFAGFTVLNFREFEFGFRGIMCRKTLSVA